MFIDTNTYIGQWPFRRTPEDTVDALLAKLSHYGVEQAWTGSFEGILHKDIAGVNERLVEACRQHDNGILIPFGSVNPVLPQWEEDLRRCAEAHGMKGIRLHPNYHGYTLDDRRFKALLEQAAAAKLVVQLVVTMEDERMMHPLMQVPHVDVAPLAEVVHWFGAHQGPGGAALQDWIGRRMVLSLHWQAQWWLPWFQFNRTSCTPHVQLRTVLRELNAVHAPWEACRWFTLPNPWLSDRRPVDMLLHDLSGVLDAAHADRLIANGHIPWDRID